MRIALIRFALTGLVCLGVAERLAAELVRAGNEFQVHSYITGAQRYPAVAMDADFDFVVVWQTLDRDGSGEGIFARRYDSAGIALGADFQVNSYTSISQLSAEVAIAGNGDFIVTWTSYHDGSGGGIFARRYSSAGTPLATEFQVNTHTLGSQGTAITPPGNAGPAIDAEPNGDFVIAWHDFSQEGVGAGGGIFGRRFDAAGNGLSVEFHVNTYTVNAQTYPSISLDGDGDFVVTWQSYAADGSQTGVFARRFASSGTAVAGEFQVNLHTLLSQRYPDVSLENNGDFVVTWQSFGQDGYGAGEGVFARRFASTGIGLATEFIVNTYTDNSQRYPSVGVDGDGDFVVTWQTVNVDGDALGVFARRFNTQGAPQGPDFQINSYTLSSQGYAAVGINPGGDFVVAWQSYGQDGLSHGIFAQRFDNIAVLDIDGNGEIGPLTDGVMILRFMFGFTGPMLVAGTVDETGCQRCDEPTILAYLNTLI